MSRSPTAPDQKPKLKEYFHRWTELGDRIQRGQSFSGRERNCVFLNLGNDDFVNVSAVSGLDYIDDGRAVATTDWDHDGDLDLWVTNRTGPRVRFLRNNLAPKYAWLQIRLASKIGNRDAIGARVAVKVKGAARPLIETVRAGAGFVSQNSKWLHFGLGSARHIEYVDIRWPDGDHERLAGFEINRSYRVYRSTANASTFEQRLPRSRNEVDLRPIPASHQTSLDEMTRIVLTRRQPLLPIQYESDDGEVAEYQTKGMPLVIHLWASWCPNCVNELTEWAASSTSFDAAKLKLLALQADSLATDRDDLTHSPASTVAFPFERGVANGNTISQLNTALQSAVYRRSTFPLPASFLLDSNGRLAVAYFGRVSTTQLINDAQLARSSKTSLESAFPIAGRSAIELFPLDPVGVAAAYEEGGYFDEAEQELVRHIVKTRRALDARSLMPSPEVRRKLEMAYLRLIELLQKQHRVDEAKAMSDQVDKLFRRK